MNQRPPAVFLADAPGLDFLNSIATPADAVIDWISDGAGYLSWLEQARMVPPAILYELNARALPGELDRVADQARCLREWFRGFVDRHRGCPLPPSALEELEPLNRLLVREEAFTQITVHSTGPVRLALQTLRRWRNPDALLLPIGAALAQLVCNESFSNVKACQDATCTLLFADHTKGHARRWCSMATCGNRAKQAAHRQRFRSPGRHANR